MRGKRIQFVVRPRLHWRNWLLVPVVFLSLTASGWLLSDYAHGRRALSGSQLEDLRDEAARLRKENVRLQEQLALAERSSQIEHQAVAEVKRNLTAVQDEMLALRQELAFYRNIVSPPDAKTGLRIQGFKLEKGGTPNHFRYKFVLAQAMNSNNAVRGAVNLVVDGRQGETPKRLPYEMIAVPKEQPLAFNFKYFQSLEGEIQLPEGFSPQSVLIQVVPQRGQQPGIEKTFEWGVALKSGGRR